MTSTVGTVRSVRGQWGWQKKYAVIREGVDVDGDGDDVEYTVTGKDYGYW
jgi:hypothetical protein